MAKAMQRHSEAQLIPVSFTLNGRLQEIDVEPHELLLDVIREGLGLTGAKRSCDVQVCGACTLLVDGRFRSPGALGSNDRGLGRRRESAPVAAGFHRARRLPVRLLHARNDTGRKSSVG